MTQRSRHYAQLIKHLYILHAAFVMFTTLSIVSAMLLASDKRWMEWHLSRLGEGAGWPAALFNFSVCIIGTLVFLLVIQLSRVVQHNNPTARTWPLILVFGVGMVQLFGIASFPYDRFVLIHNFFGYGMFYMCLAVLFFVRFFAPFLSSKAQKFGLLVGAPLLIPMLLYQLFSIGTLLVMEILGIVWIFAWFWVVIRDIVHTPKTKDFATIKS